MAENNWIGTDIGCLPQEWNIVHLGDIFKLQQGKALSQKNQTGISPHPFLRTMNVLWGRLDLSTVDQMDFTEDEIDRLSLRKNDLLICEGGDIGRTAIWNEEMDHCCCQNHVHRLRANNSSIFPRFYMYWMQEAIVHLNLYGGQGNKTTIPNLSGAKLKAFQVPKPPIQEQRAIAYVLSRIQKAIEVQDRIIAATKELKKALMQKLFTEGLHREELKDTEFGKVPKSWIISSIGSECHVGTGGTPGRNNLEYFNGTIPWVTTSELNYNIIQKTNEYITELAIMDSNAKMYPEGTLLIAMYGLEADLTRGKCALLGVPATCNQACGAINNGKRILIPFLFYYYQKLGDNIRKYCGGTKQQNINMAILKSIPIPVPPIKEQEEIINIFQYVDRQIELFRRKLCLHQQKFKSMLNLLMTGKVRVKVLEVPADAFD